MKTFNNYAMLWPLPIVVREAAERCMLVSQSYFCARFGKELQIFRRTKFGDFVRRGMEFYEKAQELVKGFDVFKINMPI